MRQGTLDRSFQEQQQERRFQELKRSFQELERNHQDDQDGSPSTRINAPGKIRSPQVLHPALHLYFRPATHICEFLSLPLTQ